MARVCELCGKGTTFTNNVPRRGEQTSHILDKTKRTQKPNIQTTRIVVDGKPRKIRVCTRCLRTLSKTR